MNITKILLALVSGLLLTGSFPSINLSWLAGLALVPLFFSLNHLSPKDSFRIGMIAGCVHYLTLMYWLVHTMSTYGGLPFYVSVPALFLLSAYLGCYLSIFSALTSKLLISPLRMVVFAPVLWVSLEYIRSFLFTGLPWCFLGYTQYNNLHLIQISDILGVYGVSYIIVLFNVVCFLALKRIISNSTQWYGEDIEKKLVLGSITGLIALLSVTWLYGWLRIDAIDRRIVNAPLKTISIVQGNIEQSIKWDADFRENTTRKYIDLSRSAAKDRPDLIVWPETSTPFYYGQHSRFTQWVVDAVVDTGTDFLIGSPAIDFKKGQIVYFNSAYLVNRDGTTIDKYDKAHLVPFGEYVPLKKWLPFLGKIVAHIGDFTPGEEGKTISWGDDTLGIQICYEIIFPNLSRCMVNNGASYLVNMTNDAWYGRSSAPYQHFSIALFRAIENRRSLIRSANTGISGFVDPVGRVILSSDLFKEAVITMPMPVIGDVTFYSRFGDIFAQFCVMTMFIASMVMVIRR